MLRYAQHDRRPFSVAGKAPSFRPATNTVTHFCNLALVVPDYAEKATRDRQPAAFVAIANDLSFPGHTCVDFR